MLRILAGSAKGKRLASLGTMKNLRPTQAKVRQAIFNILASEIHDKSVADLFAGTGAMGLEALSLGAKHCDFFDTHPSAIRLIQENVATCGFENCAAIHKLKIPNQLQNPPQPFNVIFMDPPYRKDLAQRTLQRLEAPGFIHTSGLIVVQVEKTLILGERQGSLVLENQKRYGDTAVFVYRKE